MNSNDRSHLIYAFWRMSIGRYCFDLSLAIPSFPVPLQTGEEEPMLNLQSILERVYERGRYHLAIDYTKPAQPPLAPEDTDWAAILLAEHKPKN